ncbi:methylenetetrahydrofolate reductase C-terminal domain-containing protein [Vreelandella venusta]|uniref:Methylenetetrahydrofolate reductase C-terminal domain-containing protein n=1 Tax=Vreelandella venusta TaxID=44935 RepID=A0AAP9ZH03_9GAMM|nr:methylenetetrahydrofolate reductase C-terminal domain-containing protein [Halomonas venusta]
MKPGSPNRWTTSTPKRPPCWCISPRMTPRPIPIRCARCSHCALHMASGWCASATSSARSVRPCVKRSWGQCSMKSTTPCSTGAAKPTTFAAS